jgi:hypothetical protein
VWEISRPKMSRREEHCGNSPESVRKELVVPFILLPQLPKTLNLGLRVRFFSQSSYTFFNLRQISLYLMKQITSMVFISRLIREGKWILIPNSFLLAMT